MCKSTSDGARDFLDKARDQAYKNAYKEFSNDFKTMKGGLHQFDDDKDAEDEMNNHGEEEE